MPGVTIDGKDYVIIPREEYERLTHETRLPAYPEPYEDGNLPAVAAMRVSLARKLILRRESLGWSQTEAARQAGIPKETLSRIESGSRSAQPRTVDKLDAAYSAAEAAKNKPAKPTRRAGSAGRPAK